MGAQYVCEKTSTRCVINNVPARAEGVDECLRSRLWASLKGELSGSSVSESIEGECVLNEERGVWPSNVAYGTTFVDALFIHALHWTVSGTSSHS